jgi:hypothetical protein
MERGSAGRMRMAVLGKSRTRDGDERGGKAMHLHGVLLERDGFMRPRSTRPTSREIRRTFMAGTEVILRTRQLWALTWW